MSHEQTPSSNSVFYQVFDGALRTRVREGTPDALERTNKKGVQVYEREVKALFGTIENVAIEDSDFGKQIKITLDKNEEGKNPVITFGVESKNGRDVLRKLPAVDFSKEVRIMPYRFTPDGETEEVSGISLTQQDADGKFTKKVDNYFFDSATKTYLHDFPTIDWDSATEAEQKIYKITRDEFLVKFLTENILPKFQRETGVEYPEEELKPEDIPF